jgi:hypothetical protein
MFPHADGVSKTMSPQNIIIGTMANYDLHCRVPFGAYCEVHNINDPSNTEKPRTSAAIALNPTGNLQGSYHFLSLVTGKRINRRRWTQLPITDAIIARVHELALAESDYDLKASNFVFGWDLNMPFTDDDDDTDHDPIHVPDPEGANHIDIIDGNEEEEEEQEEEEEEEQEQEQEQEAQGAFGALEAQEAPENKDDDEQGAQGAFENEDNEEQGAQGAFEQGAQ